ncbi:NAD(P)/FAD-dependent oxidoreductase [Alkalicoccobacillus porphyridii]|uniref:NAD(FAD)-utilizing dehydrogenase n=1 Tax=Alkalicoccobacillus porphyridii TaxID=2597270 RepID=A0A554A127_9BACI|nr:NAD(FAD)-utilizing dehydrogenase [Alkalicoccobacillus porphyridii]TSB47389.1 NAD(FAD)-utilizing dehydrogenase [Alkalicoccobacillus porphyridii]
MYDIIIVGSGVSSLFLALTLSESDDNQKILILEKGKPLADRNSSINQDNYVGFAGLGKSEGKFNYASGFGGELSRKLGDETLDELLNEVDEILCQFGGDRVAKYSTSNETLNEKAKKAGLQMLSTEVRHLGSKLSTEVFQRFYQVLSVSSKIDMVFEVDIEAIEKDQNGFFLSTNKGGFASRKLVVATGRSGTEWLEEQCAVLGVKRGKTRLDLGIRIEMHEQQWRQVLQDTFETKLALTYKHTTSTTYCMNPKGEIIRKYQEGLVMPDGQNFREKEADTSNLNFTLFTPVYFVSLQEANDYAKQVIGQINDGGDRIVVQRLEDFLNKKSTENTQLAKNQIRPSLEADCGNLYEEVPALYSDIVEEFFVRLQSFLGQEIDGDTLLYGIDGKFYSPIIETDEQFQTNIKGLYVIGDCSGVTSSLSQAAASGLYLGKHLMKRF